MKPIVKGWNWKKKSIKKDSKEKKWVPDLKKNKNGRTPFIFCKTTRIPRRRERKEKGEGKKKRRAATHLHLIPTLLI
jgi:hypothetical protein